MNKIKKGIIANNNAYNFLVDCAEYYFKTKNISKSLLFCRRAADYAVFNYCGFYVDDRLEKLLLEIGGHYIEKRIINTSSGNKLNEEKKILHYATSIFDVGGHTRLIENWIKADSENVHDIVVTNQQDTIPSFIIDALELANGKIHNLKEKTIIDKASTLRELYYGYDLVVLHHHPNDLIPTIAFSSAEDSPICVLNHGDHRFWLGSSVCDVLIEIRDNLVEADKLRRNVSRFALLPIPIKKHTSQEFNYFFFRAKLGVEHDEVMLLSIGSSYKYTPIDNMNFFEDVSKILISKKIKLFVIGINPEEPLALKFKSDRIVFVSPTTDIEKYKQACDIYLEGYPFSSFTAYLEVAALGKPIHRMYNPTLLNEYKIKEYPNTIYYPDSKQSWIHELNELIHDRDKRTVQGEMEKANLFIHAEHKWKEKLLLFYQETNNIKHKTRVLNSLKRLLLDPSDIFLYKMQMSYKHVIGASLNDFYDIPFRLKLKLVLLNLREKVCNKNLAFRDVMWFLFKSAGVYQK